MTARLAAEVRAWSAERERVAALEEADGPTSEVVRGWHDSDDRAVELVRRMAPVVEAVAELLAAQEALDAVAQDAYYYRMGDADDESELDDADADALAVHEKAATVLANVRSSLEGVTVDA